MSGPGPAFCRFAGMAILVLAVGGCDTFSTEAFLLEEFEGDDFATCLAWEYQEQATVEAYVDSEWRHAARFARKGRAAAAGESVLPDDPADRAVFREDLPQLLDARSRLLRALDDGGRAERACLCASAQRHFDGWVEQASDNEFGAGGSFTGGAGGPVQPERLDAERDAFWSALGYCEAPARS